MQKWRREEGAKKALKQGSYTQFTKLHQREHTDRVELRREDETFAGTSEFCEIVADRFEKIMKCDDPSSRFSQEQERQGFGEYKDAPAASPDEVVTALETMKMDRACLDRDIQ